jgi:hypothetical protein
MASSVSSQCHESERRSWSQEQERDQDEVNLEELEEYEEYR